jgi:nitrate reductase gamma subunit
MTFRRRIAHPPFLLPWTSVKSVKKQHRLLGTYHGAAAEFAGILMLLGAYLLFRGRLFRNRSWNQWTVLDKLVGAIVAIGFLFFIVQRWISVL